MEQTVAEQIAQPVAQAVAPVAEAVQKVAEATYLGNTVHQWVVAGCLAAGVLVFLYLVKTVLVARLRVLAQKTDNILDDLLFDVLDGHTKFWFFLVVAVWAGQFALTLPPAVAAGVRKGTLVLAGLQGLLWANAAVDFYFGSKARQQGKDSAAVSTYGIITFLSKLVLGALVILLTLHNLGVDITALVAGLGVGGIAVALALQNVLGDLFASMSIVLDKPFEIGDAIAVDGMTGTVEAVGLKTTRLRSVTGEQLIFANADLLKSRIRNMKRLAERRVLFTVGVAYETPREKLARVPRLLEEAVRSQAKVRFDRSHLASLGEFAIAFETVYFVLDPDLNLSLDIQQSVLLALIASLEREGIAIAYPTSVVRLLQAGGVPGGNG